MIDAAKGANVTPKHKKEINKFIDDGFVDGCVYKNTAGEERLLDWANFPKGTIGGMIKAFSDGDTVIEYRGEKSGHCSIAEWNKWLGDKWELAIPGVEEREPTAVEVVANAKLAAYKSGNAVTPKYPEPKDGKKWRSPNPKKKNS